MIDKPISVLLIEDNQGDARLLKEYLREGAPDQFTLVHTKKLSTGLKRLAKIKPDIVLLELDLPDSQGLDTFKKVCAQAPNMPIVILTGMSDSDRAIAAVQAGAQDYLAKGELNSNVLVRAIQYAIERKRDERELKKEKEIAQQYLDVAGVMLVAFDVDGKITLINKKGCEILGYQADEIIGKRWIAKCIPKRMRSDVENVFVKIAAGEVEAVEKHENPVLTKSGEERLIAWNNSVLLDETGAITGILSSGEDITERVQADQELRDNEEQYRRLFESVSVGIGLVDQAGNFIAFNDAMLSPGGYSREDILKIGNIAPLYANPAQRTQILETLQKEGVVHDQEVQFKRKDGTVYDALISLSKVQIKGQVYIQAMVEDITERKLAEEALQQQAAELAAINTLGRAVTANLELQETTHAAVEEMLDTVQCDLAFFFLRDDDRLILEEVLPANSKQRLGDIPEHRVGECMCGLAVREKKALYSQDIHNDSRCTWDECKRAGFKSFAALPLMSGDEVIGVIGLASDTERDFERQGGFLETLAGQVSVGLVNAQIYETAQLELAERKKAEEQLSHTLEKLDASEKRLKMIIETEPECVKVLTPNGTLVDMNRAGLDMIEADSLEQVRGKSILSVIAPEYRQAFSAMLDNVIRGKTETLVFEIIGLKKTRRWLETHSAPLYGAGNKITGLLGVTRDITEQVQAEQALQESEARFKQIAETIEDVFVLSDVKNKSALYASPAFEKVWGRPVQDLYDDIGIWDQAIHPEDVKDIQEAWERMKEKGESYEAEYRVIHQDGSIRWVRSRGYPVHNESGQVYRYVSSVLDITGRKLAEEALQKSQALFRQAEVISKIGHWEWDYQNDRMVSCSEQFARMYEMTVDEAVKFFSSSKAYLSLIPPEDREWFEQSYQDSIEKRERHELEYKIVTLSGTVRHIRSVIERAVNDQGELVSGVGVEQDITDRVQAEAALRESEARFKQIAETIEDIFVLTDVKNWSVLYVSPAYEKIFGRPVQDFYDDARRWQEAVHPDDRQRTMEAWARMKEQGGTYEEEYRVIHTDGSVRWVRNRRYPIHDEHGQVYRVAGIVQDITERVQAEAVIKRATDEIKRLYRASGALLASASPNVQDLGQAIVDAVLVEFEHTNCSLILAQPGSQQLKRIAAAGPYADEVSKGKISLDGAGLVPQAIRSGQIIYAPDVTQNPEYVPNWKSARSELAVPLKVDSRIVGVIDIQSAEIGAFTPDDERLLSLFAERAALALENARLFREANQRLERLTSLREVDQTITSSLDLRMTMDVLLGHILRQLEVDAAAVLLYQPNQNNLEFVVGQGFRSNVLQNINLRLDQGYAGPAALERRIVKIPDLGQRETGFLRSPELRAEQFVAYIGVPLISKGVVVGVLEIYHRQPLDPDPEWMEYLETLAGQAAIAIDNINLFVNLQSSNEELVLAYDATIEGWAQALELRDMEVEGHSRRVVDLTINLARDLGVGENEMANISRGALLHDIGKMGVSDAILQKPGKLNEEEWQIMRQHPVFAHEWLSSIQYLQHALDIPYCHHEKWDGTGYPRGLKGEQIPLAARIFAVVDVWDALCSDRPYRKAWSREKALKHIQEQSGIHFDPQVVEAFSKQVV